MRITCEAKDFLDIDVLTDFQGGLKSRSPEDIAKIQKSIQQYGFAAPFFVWFHDGIYHVLDGHGRLQALKDLQQHGEHIPPLPVVYIRCQNEAEAKNILLRINSTYGTMSSDSIAHENVLVFLKGNGKQAASELGDIQASNCVLPEFDQE